MLFLGLATTCQSSFQHLVELIKLLVVLSTYLQISELHFRNEEFKNGNTKAFSEDYGDRAKNIVASCKDLIEASTKLTAPTSDLVCLATAHSFCVI